MTVFQTIFVRWSLIECRIENIFYLSSSMNDIKQVRPNNFMLARIIMNEKGVLPEKLNPKYLFTAWMRAISGVQLTSYDTYYIDR